MEWVHTFATRSPRKSSFNVSKFRGVCILISSFRSLYLCCNFVRSRAILPCSPWTRIFKIDEPMPLHSGIDNPYNVLSFHKVNKFLVLNAIDVSRKRNVVHRTVAWNGVAFQSDNLLWFVHDFLKYNTEHSWQNGQCDFTLAKVPSTE